MIKFQAEIKKVEDKDATYIEMPFDVYENFGAKRVKVKANFDGVEYRGSIVNMGLDCHIIGITKAIRTAIGKSVGDTINVELVKDEEERIIELPEDFKSELEKNEEAKSFYNSLPHSAKKKYYLWITGAKKEETRTKRIHEGVLKLQEKKRI